MPAKGGDRRLINIPVSAPFKLWLWLALVAALGRGGAGGAEVLRFELVPQESRITARVRDPFGRIVSGEFALREGEVRGDPADPPRGASVTLVVDAASYDSGLGVRNQDVRTYYLEAERYPEIRFTSRRVEALAPAPADGSWHLRVTGTLELHGVRREIAVPVAVRTLGNRIVAEGRLKVALRDYAIAVPTLLFYFRAGEEAEVTFRFVGQSR